MSYAHGGDAYPLLEALMNRRIAPTYLLALTATFVGSLAIPALAQAQQQVKIPQGSISYEEKPEVTLPLVICWHDGKKDLYIQTEASDPTIAQQQGVNYVPQLSNAIDAPNGAVDDIYVFTNSEESDQYNILPSEPKPVGPYNRDTAYSPLWQVSKVTWKDGVRQRTLTSEKEVLDAEAKGLVLVEKTRAVLNCPVLYTDAGGLLPKAVVRLKDGDGDDGVYRNK
jgi:hypothetical protein